VSIVEFGRLSLKSVDDSESGLYNPRNLWEFWR